MKNSATWLVLLCLVVLHNFVHVVSENLSGPRFEYFADYSEAEIERTTEVILTTETTHIWTTFETLDTTEKMNQEVQRVTTEEPGTAEVPDTLLWEDCTSPRVEDFNRESRIVGGSSVDERKFPWMVSIFYWARFICGGTKITPVLVLTAAHCLVRKNPTLFLVKQLSEFEITAQVFVHPEFWRFGHDAGVLRLKEPFVKSDLPLCISRLSPPGVGSPLRILGRGRLKEDGPSSEDLLTALIQVLPDEPCRKYYKRFFNKNFLCAGTPSGVPDFCHGDSGGPILRTIGGVWHQVGIVSFGDGCGRPEAPGVYSLINLFFPWLKDIVESSHSSNQKVTS